MPPKHKPIAQLGAVVQHGNGWRAKLCIANRIQRGPTRSTNAAAQIDLHQARRCADRESMAKCLATLLEQVRASNGSSGVAQPPSDGPRVDCETGNAAEGVAQPFESTGNGDSDISVEQPVFGAQAVTPSAKASSSNIRNGFAQPRAKKARVANEGRSSGGSHSAAVSDDQKVLLLQLKREFYNAIKSRRKQWEARPLFNDKNKGPGPSLCNKLAIVGRAVVLQSGAGTNDRVRIAEVRRYDSVQDMVAELAAGLLPDLADARSRVEAYESLYGPDACARGFVAMRLEWPNEAAAATTSKGTSGSNVRITSTSSVSDAAPLPTADRTCTSPIGCGKIFCVQCHP